MPKLLMIVGPMLIRLLSQKVAKDLLATVVNQVIDKVQAKLVGRLPGQLQDAANEIIDKVQAELVSDSGLADLLNLVTNRVKAGPTVAER